MFLVGSVGLVREGRDVEQGLRQEAGTVPCHQLGGGDYRVCTSLRSTAFDTPALHSMVFWNRDVICYVVTDVSEEYAASIFRDKDELFNVGACCQHHQDWHDNDLIRKADTQLQDCTVS
jgi:hypothetical protein